MAKQVEDVVTDDRVESLKTVKFGGYDKASVDYYIDELKGKHNKEVEELKANVNKLSEAVLSLKTMREVNMTESSKTIETLKKTNSEQESEIESLKEQINAYKQRELENAGRYESISRTLLEARESADALIAQTEKECTDKKLHHLRVGCLHSVRNAFHRAGQRLTVTSAAGNRGEHLRDMLRVCTVPLYLFQLDFFQLCGLAVPP